MTSHRPSAPSNSREEAARPPVAAWEDGQATQQANWRGVGGAAPRLERQLPDLERATALVCWIAIIAYFCWYATGGLRAHFSPDDMQNIYMYWSPGWRASASAIFTFWSSFYRPLGALFYLPLFRLTAFDPVPYRFAILALVTFNAVIYAALCRIVSRSQFATLVALSLWLFHGALLFVYSNAIIYDIAWVADYDFVDMKN